MDTFAPGRVAHATLAQPVMAALRRAIILGELPPGLHLEEPALAEKFGVSRIPIREAFIRLSHEGLIRLEPRRGAFVIGTTEDDIYDLYELRSLLETHALRRAANHIDNAALAKLQIDIDRMRAALQGGQAALIATADIDFHYTIITLSDSRPLLAAWEQIIGLVSTMLGIADASLPDMTTPVESHQAIADALARRDMDEARGLVREHLRLAPLHVCDAVRAVRGLPPVDPSQRPATERAASRNGNE